MWVQGPHQVFTALTSHLVPNPFTLSFLTLAFSSHSLILHPPDSCPPSVSFDYPAHFNLSSILSMSIVRLIGLSCPLHPLIHLIHALRPSYPLQSCPTRSSSSTLSLYTVPSICLSCPSASLHPPYPCTLSVPSAYPAHCIPSSILSMYTVNFIRLSCPTAPLHPFIHPIHVHCLSHLFILPSASLHPPYACTLLYMSVSSI
jgi:hypothetical protein